MKRSAKLLLSSQESGTTADVEMAFVCERNTLNITDVVTGGDHTDISSGTT